MRTTASSLGLCIAISLLSGLGGSSLRAQPSGGQVVAGTATLSSGGGALTVTQTSARAIINWDDFSLAAGQSTKFIQPDALSATLNRVISGLPSSLAGTMEANGRVYLINPNGILIGAGARIDTGGFLASTLDVANHEFLAGGDLHFSGGSTAAITNLGAINALGGDVFLIARQVENRGSISAGSTGLTAGGTAGIAAGSEVLLTTGGNERLFVQATSLPGAIVNSGAIAATTAELKAAGGNAYALAINNSGLVRATGSAVRNGQVWLVASGNGAVVSGGTLVASSSDGAQGGEVRVLGEKVTLAAGAVVDVSGTLGGGTALIGGDFQGRNAHVRNAQTTTVDVGAKISADAIASGNGGKVIVWADHITRFDGAIFARGGATGGSGGFAEISGKALLDFRGQVDLRGFDGRNGSLLLDPDNLTIGSTADLNGNGSTGDDAAGNIAAGDYAGFNSFITAAAVSTLLGTTNLSLAATNNITVASSVNWNSAFGLTLTAGNALAVNAAIVNAGSGAVALNADNGITLNANLTTAAATTLNADQNNDGTGTLTVANNITVATTNSALNVTAADVALVFFGALNSGTAATSITASADRSIGLGGTAGDLSLTNTEMNRITASRLALNTTGLSGDVTVNGITSGGNNSGPVTINAGGTVTFATAASTFFKGVTANANDGVAVGADITASNGNIVLDGDADSIATPGDGIVFTGVRTLTTGIDFAVPHDPTQGSITLRNGATGANGNIASAALNLRAADNITIADDFTATNATFSAIANNPGGANYLNAVNGKFTLESGKTLSTASSGDIEIMASTVALDGNLQSVAAVNITASRNTSVNLGLPQTQVAEPHPPLSLTDAALGRITATGLTIGIEPTGIAAIYMKGLTAANTDQFGTMTLTTPGFVGFEGTSVVGNRLTASGLGGIVFYNLANLSTSTAVIPAPHLSLAGNNIMFNASVTVTAGGTGTLTLNPTDTFVSNGNLTLESGDDLTLTRALSSYGTFIFNADKNNDGTGTFTVPTGIAVTTTAQFGAQSINITAADVVLAGTATLNSTAGPTNVTASAGRSAGLGATVVAGGLNIAGSEFQQITATGFTLTSAGNITVDGISEPSSNKISAITTLTANGGTSAVSFLNTASTFNALTVNSTTTIANNATLTLDTGNLILNAGTDITQTGAIEIGAFTANLTGAAITLNHADNTLGAVTVNTGAGNVSLREDSAITVAGITRTSGNLTLNAATDITQTALISIGSGTGNFTADNITLTRADNTMGDITVNSGAGNVSIRENSSISVAAITRTSGNLTLNAEGDITQTGDVEIGTGTANLTGANITLNRAANTMGVITVNAGTGNVAITEDSTVSIAAITHTGNVTLVAATDIVQTGAIAIGSGALSATASGHVTLGTGATIAAGSVLATAVGNVSLGSGATIAATGGAADPLVLVAGGNFINSSTDTALNPGTGRWLVYSTSPAGSTENGLTAAAGSTSPRLYNKTYVANAPATIAAGNHLLYSAQPVFTVTADDKTRVYGAANPAFTTTVTGFVVDDGVTDTATSAGLAGATGVTSTATATSPVSSSPFAITPTVGSLVSSAGYSFGFAAGALSITKAELTLSGTRVYNGTTEFAGSNLTATGVNGETFAVGGTGASGNLSTKNVQTSQALGNVTGLTLGSSGNGGLAGNYNSLATTGSSVSVTKANLSVSTSDVVKTYDGGTSAAGSPVVTLGTLFTGDALAIGPTGASYAFVGGDAGIGNKTVTIAGVGVNDGNNGGNYTLTLASNTTSTINRAPLTITAGDATKVYGAALPSFTASYTGFVNNETAAVVTGLQLGTTATAASNVGSYAITPSSGTASNYTLSYTAGSLGVTPAALAIAANNASKVYGAALPTFTATYSGLVNGDTSAVVTGLTIATSATAASNVGSYVITPSSGTASNYTLSYTAGALGVTPAALAIAANDASKVYGAALPTFTATYTRLVNGDTSAVVTGLAFATPATASSNVGNYAITPSSGTASNYTLSYTAGTLGITPAALTIIADSKSRAFGVANPALTATFTGLVNSDSSAVVTGLTLGTTAVQSSPVGSYPITATSATAANYTLTFVDGIMAVGQNLLTITADSLSKIYGAGLPSFTATYAGLLNGDTSAVVTGLQFSTTASIGSNVGTYAITPFGGSATSYTLAYVPGLLTINPAALTITANSATRTYGANNPTFGASYTGLVNGDTSAVVTGLAFATPATASSNVGNYAITPSSGTASSYTLSYSAGTLGVTPAALAIAANDAGKVYGAALPTLTATYTGLINGDTSTVVTGLAITTPATASSNVGSYAITPSSGTASNYTLSYSAGALGVTPAALTIAADNKSRAFGVANPALTATFTGLVNSDSSAVVTGLALGTNAILTSPAGNYPITAAGATAQNYAVTFVDGVLAVGQSQSLLTITADSLSKIYGAALPAFTATYAGLLNGDTSAVVTGLQFSTTASIGSNVGTYAITPFGGTATSYTLAYVPGLLTINPAALSITANSASRTYGAANPAFGASFTGLVNGDTSAVVTGLAITTPATASSNVGSYAITPSSGTASNYTLSYTPGALAVTPAALTISADNKSRAFGVANPALTATFAGLVNSDSSAVVTGLALGTNAILTSPVGNYPITAAGATAQNYAVTFVDGVLAVGQSQSLLTITADNLSKIYGAALPAFTATYSGLLNGDTSAVVTGLQFSTTASVGSNVGTYAITPFGGSATSYTLAYVPGLLTINPAALAITANSASRTYGATNPAFGASFTGLVNGDTSAVVTGLTIATPASVSSNVGSYAITPSSGTASNYTLSYTAGALGVTPASLAVTADGANKTYGAANPAFRATFSGFVNGDSASVVSGLTFTTPASTVSGAGAYAIVPGNAVAANYALTFIPGTLTVNRASLTLTAANAAREFGASNPAFSATFSGLVNGDTAAAVSGLSFTTPATSTSPIGDYIISPVAAVAANYTFVFVNGTLRVVAPAVTTGTTPLPVTTINQQPVLTSELAVVQQGGRLVLLPVDTQGTVANATSSPSVSLDGQLAAELSEVTRLPRLASATNAPGTSSDRALSSPNLGGFQLVTSLGGGAGGSTMGGATGLTVAQMNEPGLFREASVNMGRYNIIYHEALADAHQQTKSNTALGSSYREFLDTEQPRVNIVRAATEGDPGNGPAKPAAGRNGEGAQ